MVILLDSSIPKLFSLGRGLSGQQCNRIAQGRGFKSWAGGLAMNPTDPSHSPNQTLFQGQRERRKSFFLVLSFQESGLLTFD